MYDNKKIKILYFLIIMLTIVNIISISGLVFFILEILTFLGLYTVGYGAGGEPPIILPMFLAYLENTVKIILIIFLFLIKRYVKKQIIYLRENNIEVDNKLGLFNKICNVNIIFAILYLPLFIIIPIVEIIVIASLR